MLTNRFHIYSFPRIHFSLIGMCENGYRINGGIGCSISAPVLDCNYIKSDKLQIIDNRRHGFTDKEINRLENLIERVIDKYHLYCKYKCLINGDVIAHIGLGSSTMIYLSCVEALFIMNKYTYDKGMVIQNSSRGGTSGIGINTYFSGGFVLDIGINGEDRSVRPSSLGQRQQLPVTLAQFNMPKWDVGIRLLCKTKYKSVLSVCITIVYVACLTSIKRLKIK